MTVLRWFEQQAVLAPDAVAVIFEQRRLTYWELNGRATIIASALVQAGVQPGDLVGLFVPRSADMLAALLGIWKAGGAYVPVDPTHPADRIGFMLQDSGANYLITHPGLAAVLPQRPRCTLFLDQMLLPSDRREVPASIAAGSLATPDGLAYLIYTSGSTGTPKGAMICHRSLAEHTRSMQKVLQLQPSDVMFATTTITFDPSNTEMLTPLIAGASIFMTERDCARDGRHMAELLTLSAATAAFATPTTYRLLLEAGWKGSKRMQVIVGGEALPLGLARALATRARAVWNVYGPTETTIWSTYEKIEPGVEKVTIGRPFENVSVYVLDKDRQRVPPGYMGDLFIGGAGVGLGYHNRPELTASCFLPDPFSATPGARMYRTGDLGIELLDGRFEFIGRADDQVKLRGFRIELGEIESWLAQCDGVQAAVVRVVSLEPGDERLIAFLVSQREIPEEAYRDWLKQKLPAYMVPSEFVRMDRFPMTPSGKVDRRALDRIRLEALPASAPAPGRVSDDLVARLTELWERFLKISPIPPTANFFEIGGHSLLAARMIAEMERQFGGRIPISVLVQRPTIQSMAAYLGSHRSGVWPGPALMRKAALSTGPAQPSFFLVHGMGGSLMSFRDLATLLDPAISVYGMQLPLRLPEDYETGLLEKLSARYIEEMRELQPQGPYYLGGHSSGGQIAFEMARQLTAMGQSVGLLALLDSDYEEETHPRSPFHSWASLRNAVHGVLGKTSRLGLREVLRRRMVHEKLRLQIWITALSRKVKAVPVPGSMTTLDSQIALALRAYDPPPWPGDAMLFVAGDESRRHRDATLGWASKILGRIEMVQVPGIHDTMLWKPEVAALAAQLNERICSPESSLAPAPCALPVAQPRARQEKVSELTPHRRDVGFAS